MIAEVIATTTTALLDGLFDSQNDSAWRTFHDRYQPIILGFCRRLGLSDADAADVTQETLLRFVKEYRRGRYDRDQGRLRSWIIGIARFRVADLNRQTARRREHRGDSALGDLSDDEAMNKAWDESCRSEILRRAMDELRESTRIDARTLTTFECIVLREMSIPEVAKSMGISQDSVYKARQRCLRRLRPLIEHLTQAYEC